MREWGKDPRGAARHVPVMEQCFSANVTAKGARGANTVTVWWGRGAVAAVVFMLLVAPNHAAAQGQCNDTSLVVVDCRQLRLSSVPLFANNQTLVIALSDNLISFINNSDFKGLTALRKLGLANNKITARISPYRLSTAGCQG